MDIFEEWAKANRKSGAVELVLSCGSEEGEVGGGLAGRLEMGRVWLYGQ